MKLKDLARLARGFAGRRILVVGDAMLDEYLHGEVSRVSPEAPVPVVKAGVTDFFPGGAGNTAANIAALGGTAELFTVVGDDEHGRRFVDCLRGCGISEQGVVVDALRPTTTKTRVVATHHQLLRVDRESVIPISRKTEDELLARVRDSLPGADACVISDYAKGVVTSRLARRIIQLANSRPIPIVVDPKGSDPRKYRGATVVAPNTRELAQALGRERIEEDERLKDTVLAFRRRIGVAAVLLTRGSAGMMLASEEGRVDTIQAAARQVFDVTGAGDTVVAIMALTLAVGGSIREAAELANRAAGIVVSKRGTATVQLGELLSSGSGP